MASESGTDEEGDTLELADSYKVKGKYPEGCNACEQESECSSMLEIDSCSNWLIIEHATGHGACAVTSLGNT